MLHEDIEDRYKFKHISFTTENNLYKTYKFVFNQLKTHNPEIVIVPECGVVSVLVVLYRLLNKVSYRIVSIIDDSFDMLINNNQFSKKHILAEKILVPFFDDIITVEPKVRDFFQKKYKKGVSFPIIRDESIFRSQLKESIPIANRFRTQYNLNGKKLILFVGRLVKQKNVQTLIQAINKLNRNDIKLIIVGTGEEEEYYRSLSNKEYVLFVGRQTGASLLAWYHLADIFVLPSIKEAFGAVTNEALMSGCWCVVSERAGSNCLIREDENGNTFFPLDMESLTLLLKKRLKFLPNRNTEKIKPCLMPFTFEHCFSEVMRSLKS